MTDAKKIDLHMHSTVSDGTDTPEELLDHIREAGLTLFSLTDHDAVKGCARVRRALRDGDPQFVNGVEFSCRDEEGKYHILGYGYDPDSEPVRRIVDKGHGLRMRKAVERLEHIRKIHKIVLPEDETERLLALDNPGKPHIANLLVKWGYAVNKEDALDRYLSNTGTADEYIRPEEAITGIRQGGGIAVLAHPSYGSGNEVIVGAEMERRVRKLIDFGLRGLECFYSGFSPKLCNEMLDLADRYALYVTAGSDYHGKNKLVRLGMTGYDELYALPEGMRRFLAEVRRV